MLTFPGGRSFPMLDSLIPPFSTSLVCVRMRAPV
jgi:hypothetical protein